MTNIIKNDDVKSIKVDEATVIKNYGFSTDVYDIVEGFFDGEHGTVLNKKSTKTYYIISGRGKFYVDDEAYSIDVGDIISIEPNSWLKIEGVKLKALIISNPPFNTNDEIWK